MGENDVVSSLVDLETVPVQYSKGFGCHRCHKVYIACLDGDDNEWENEGDEFVQATYLCSLCDSGLCTDCFNNYDVSVQDGESSNSYCFRHHCNAMQTSRNNDDNQKVIKEQFLQIAQCEHKKLKKWRELAVTQFLYAHPHIGVTKSELMNMSCTCLHTFMHDTNSMAIQQETAGKLITIAIYACLINTYNVYR